MANELMDIDQLDFEEEEFQEPSHTAEEEIFGAQSNFTKDWVGENYHPENNSGDNNTEEKTDDDFQNGEDEDIISYLLKEKGIKDPSQIKFEGENGELETRDWNSLSLEEQYNILNTPHDTSDTDLDDQEIQLINQLRLRGISPEEFVQMVKNEGAQEYASTLSPEQNYVVDDFNDEELYIYDMKARVPDMTEDELAESLQAAQANPQAFEKQIAGLREEYKRLEEEEIQQEQAINQEQQQAQFEEFQNNVYNAIGSIEDIGGSIELENEDRDLLAEFILGKDNAGVSYLGKALNDPETLVKMSWFALRGEEALDDIQNYYAEQIKIARQAGYNEGLAARDGGKAPRVAIQKPKGKNKISAFSQSGYDSIDDLDFNN